MGGIRTIAAAGLILFMSKGLMASGFDDPLGPRHIASCAGRLSAQMAHEWLMQSDAAEATERHRAHLLDVLAAISGPEAEAALLNLRIEAKAAHAALLRRATFGDDPADRAWATRTAEAHVRVCTAMLLS